MEDSEEEEDDPDGGMYSEEDVLVVMEFAGLGRAAAIELLREFGGDTEAVLASMYP
jgi:NACalpha-BTF3-like transcription factor